MSRYGRTDAMMYSLSEFAFILAFLCIGLGALVYGRYRASEEIAERQRAEIEVLTAEVAFLNEILEEKQYGNVPCWRRPDATIPFVVGRLTIHDSGTMSAVRAALTPSGAAGGAATDHEITLGGRTLDEALRPAVVDLFRSELAYAGDHNCYLRLEVANETDEFSIYRDVAAIVTRIGMVAVHE